MKRQRIEQLNNCEENNNVGGITLPDCKTGNTPVIIKMVWFLWSDRHLDQ